MPQFHVQRSNTNFIFLKKISATFFWTQSVKDTRNVKKREVRGKITQELFGNIMLNSTKPSLLLLVESFTWIK